MYLCTRNRKVVVVSSSIFAEIAQLVEHNLAKVGVASSSLVFRSKWKRQLQAVFFHFALSEMMARTKRPQVAPSRGWGCKYKFARNRSRAGRRADRRPWIVFRLRPKVTGQNQAQYGKIRLSTKAAYPIKLAGGFRDVIYSKIYTGVSLYLSKAR